MAKESALYQLMGVRMNGIMNDITNSYGEYQEITRKSDIYSGRLEEMELPEEIRLLNIHTSCIPIMYLQDLPLSLSS